MTLPRGSAPYRKCPATLLTCCWASPELHTSGIALRHLEEIPFQFLLTGAQEVLRLPWSAPLHSSSLAGCSWSLGDAWPSCSIGWHGPAGIVSWLQGRGLHPALDLKALLQEMGSSP